MNFKSPAQPRNFRIDAVGKQFIRLLTIFYSETLLGEISAKNSFSKKGPNEIFQSEAQIFLTHHIE